ncbi:RNA-directed DNA polymerase, eukaryota, reverse transcriptase zinc-binding domain protein, partial [Tanacetum coccineum]
EHRENNEAQSDGFTNVQNRKWNGKKVANGQKQHTDGAKLDKTKTKYVWNVKKNVTTNTKSNLGINVVNQVGIEVRRISLILNSELEVVDSESEVEDMVLKHSTNDDTVQRASTLSQKGSDVFQSWDWTSNASLCSKGCRIILGWNKDIVDVLVVAQTNQAVHTKVIHRTDNKIIFYTFIYAGNDPKERRILWADLEIHKNMVRDMSWVMLGDFNVALNLEDSFASSSGLNAAMCDFKDCIQNIEVIDINSSGLHFTWNQKPRGGGGILKKLDRVMGNLEFVDNFPGAYAFFQPYRISDHAPSVLKISSLSVAKPKPFKFYNFIAHKENFLEVISSQWNTSVTGHHMYQVVQRMKRLKNLFVKCYMYKVICMIVLTGLGLSLMRFKRPLTVTHLMEF